MGVDAAFDLARFKRGFDIQVTSYEGDDMEFEMRGVSCAVRGSGPRAGGGRGRAAAHAMAARCRWQLRCIAQLACW